MAITNATTLADYAAGISTQNATLKVDSGNKRVGIGTTNPKQTLQVGTAVSVYGNSGIVSATSFYGDGTNLTNVGMDPGVIVSDQILVLGVTTSTSAIVGSAVTINSTGIDAVSGIITAATFKGDLTGDVTGNVTGNASGTAGGLTGTPDIAVRNITGVAATFTGVLTYEDVTNVDSVGIVTARGGLEVGAAGVGGTISSGGNVIFAGITTVGTALSLADNIKASFGNSNDLQIYHDPSNAFIANNGSGDFYIQGGNIKIRNVAGSANMAEFVSGQYVNLYYNTSKKFATTGYGATISGGACISGLTTAFGGLTVAGTMVESMSSTTTAYNTSGDLNITNGNFHFNSANLGGTGTTLNIMSTAGINTTTKVNQVLNVTAVTAVNASTAFVNKVTIDGKATGITTHWVGGSVPTDGGGSGVDTYSFNILKTGSETYIIVANQVKTS